MHEMSIAESILETVQAESERQKARVVKIGLRIGELSGVNAECLRFALDVLTESALGLEVEETSGTELEYAWMEVEDT